MASKTSISNLALAEVPHGPIQDFNEDSKAAAECRRAYAQALGELLEASRWTFATRRVLLEEASNARSPSWAYAYAIPSNMAVLHSLAPSPVVNANPYVPTYGQTFSPLSILTGSFSDREQQFPYERDENRIYTDCPGAVAEFTAGDAMEAQFPPLFIRALAFDLAAHICTPLTGDGTRRPQLMGMYEQARGRAMAADLNRRPFVLDPIPEALAVR